MSFTKLLKIYQTKMRGRNDSIFYDGEIASVEKPNGTKLLLMALGDINFTYKDSRERVTEYRSAAEICDAGWTDTKMENRKDKLYWVNNNWFEILLCKSGENEYSEYGLDNIEFDYDSGILMLRECYFDPTI